MAQLVLGDEVGMSFDPNQNGTLSVFDFKTMALPPFGADDLVCRQINSAEADLMQLVMDKAGNYPPNAAATRLAKKQEGYIGLVKADDNSLVPVTYGWVTFEAEPLGESGWIFDTPPGDVWLYDFATVPAFRGRGYYPTLLRFILHQLSPHSVKRAWIGTAPGNAVSARSIARAGFLKVTETAMVFSPDGKPTGFNLTRMPGISAELSEAAEKIHVKSQK